jgi:thymidylate synthase (FAD)
MHTLKYISLERVENNIFGDNIAYVEKWDFSKANINHDSRVEAVTKVASICYSNPNAVGRESLYDRLKAEAMGLPSSSFEFIPVLLNSKQIDRILEPYGKAVENKISRASREYGLADVVRFGEFVDHEGETYLLTNFRALLSDSVRLKDESIAEIFNHSELEQQIIKSNSNVFMAKMDIATARQFNRSRIMLQELSRRYVNGKKEPFEIYLSEPVKQSNASVFVDNNAEAEVNALEYCNLGIELYLKLLKDGVPAEEARRVIPVGAYTKIWSSFLPRNMKNFYDLRLDIHAQNEIRLLAKAMKGAE